MKPVMQTVLVGEKCDICRQVEAKQQRRATEVERLNFVEQGGAIPLALNGIEPMVSIDNSCNTIKALDFEIDVLKSARRKRSRSRA